MKRQGAGWEDKPEGWDKGSMKEYLESLTGDAKHKVSKCIKELKGAEWLDDPNDPAPFCASLVDEIEGTGWRGGTTREEPMATQKKKKKKAAPPVTQMQTQQKYLKEKGKGGPKKETKQKQPKDKKGPGKFKKWLLEKMNFPQEEIEKMGRTEQRVVDLSDPKVVDALLKRHAFMSEQKEKSTMRSRKRVARRRRPLSRRRSRYAAENQFVKEMNPNYDEPTSEDIADFVEDGYDARPYDDFPKPPKNEREGRLQSRRRRVARIRRRIRQAIAEEMEQQNRRERRARRRRRASSRRERVADPCDCRPRTRRSRRASRPFRG